MSPLAYSCIQRSITFITPDSDLHFLTVIESRIQVGYDHAFTGEQVFEQDYEVANPRGNVLTRVSDPLLDLTT